MAKALVPIVLLIFIGWLLRRIKFVSEETISGVKSIATNVFLPAVIFNVFVTAEFSRDSIFIFLLSLLVLIFGFIGGFLVKKLYKKSYKDYIPFVTVTFEGGMLGYALGEILFGADKLYYIATVDLAGAIFSFTIWVTMLGKVGVAEDNKERKKKNIILDMISSPTLDASIVGLIVGLSGLGKKLLESSFGDVYTSCIDYLSAPLTPVILISLGYGLSISMENAKEAIVIIFQRILLLTAVFLVLFVILKPFITFNTLLVKSMIIYFALPPSFLLSVYVKEKKSQDVISCVLSIYMIITLVVFCILLAGM